MSQATPEKRIKPTPARARTKASTVRPIPEAPLTRGLLLEDLRRVVLANPGVTLTRNFYRANANPEYPESSWQGFFPKFEDFLAAAGVSPVTSGEELVETSEIVGDKWSVCLPRTDIHTLDGLLAYCEVDQKLWIVERFVVNKWALGSKDPEGNVRVTPLYQVKATLRRNVEMSALIDEVDSLIKLMQKNSPVPLITYKRDKSSGNMLEINIPDLHAGKLAWDKETGYQNYDSRLAITTFRRALAGILSRVMHLKFDKVLFVVGNDLLHSDDLEGRTTSGTYVNTDGRYHKTFVEVRNLMIEAIETLRQIAPVKVISVVGNHDTKVAWHITDSLSMYFRKYKDVEVDYQPTPRKFQKWGDVMLMFTHGHQGKRNQYPLLMATEQRKMWGDAKFCEIHTGHLHQVRTEEMQGVRIRILSALCPPDAWHSNNGFVGNLRSAEAFVWNDKEGLTLEAYYNEAD